MSKKFTAQHRSLEIIPRKFQRNWKRKQKVVNGVSPLLKVFAQIQQIWTIPTAVFNEYSSFQIC